MSPFFGEACFIGRFMGVGGIERPGAGMKRLLLAAIPIAACLLLGAIRGWSIVAIYLPFVALCWILFQLGRSLAARTLMIFSLSVVALLLIAIVAGGKLAMWCVVGAGLFTSIGWSNTFSLAIEGVGIYKSQASSLLVMAILGGAILPPLQGLRGRPVKSANLLHRSGDRLCLCRFLRLERTQGWTQIDRP